MNGNECLVICLFQFIVYKSQVDSRSKINLLLGKLMAEIPDLMASFGNKIADFNKYIHSIGTALCAHGENSVNLLLQIFATYTDCSSYNGLFTRYIGMLENQHSMGQ